MIQMEPCAKEQFGDLECGQDLWSAKDGGDSNAIILPGKRMNKKKGKNQVHEKLRTKKMQKLTKSQKRKLNKIEEEKEKALLLSKSIETLEKYKIRDDAYALMWSSRNLGQVETVHEQRRREVQFSKAGLALPHSDKPFKRKAVVSPSCEIEPDSETVQSTKGLVDIDFWQPAMAEKEVTSKTSLAYSEESVSSSGLGAVDGYDATDPVEEIANKNNETCMREDAQDSLPMTFNSDRSKSNSPLDQAIESQKRHISSTTNLVDCPPQGVLCPPVVVHVLRPKEVEKSRKDLPIVMWEQEIMEAINGNNTVIICGETGCGKTTQVPQFLYEAGFGSDQSGVRSGIIGVTQPRRIVVLETARRVAFELGLREGKEVGFQVRHDRKIGNSCSIKFMTDGILLREVQSDFLLRKYSIIILDEAHQRSLHTDILIGMLSRVIQQRQIIYEEQQRKVFSGERISRESMIFPLKLVLMSATLRVDDFVSGRRIFLNPPPLIEVPTRQFPVTVHFSKRTEIVDYIGQAYKKVLSIHKRLPPGGILVFVTGQREVENLCRRLRKTSKELVENSSKRNTEKEVSTIAAGNSIEENDMKEINEAFEMHGTSQTDRFSSDDVDLGDSEDNESDFSDDMETDSDLEGTDDVDLLNHDTETIDDLSEVFRDEGKVASLTAAFKVLGEKTTLNPDSDEKQDVPSTPKSCSNQSIPNVGEKRGAAGLCAGAMCVRPLYSMLPASAARRACEGIREGERLVVVATNVAETSLTIPGVKYVVDTGREKVKNYNSSNGIETYEVQWISKASAAQRAGRAGRTAPGHCYRLYSSAVFNNIFPDFSSAEISKVPVDDIVLIMKSMGVHKVSNFPFPTPPEVTALAEAERCLTILEALDSNGRLTPLGKAMARYPIRPRHSRMLLTVIQIMRKVKSYDRANLVLGYAVAAAASMSCPNPFVMQFEGSHKDMDGLKQDEEKSIDKEEKLGRKKLKESAKLSREKFSNPSSDVLTIAYALQCFERSIRREEFCNDHSLHLKTMEEISKLRKQLLQQVFNQSTNDPQQEFSWTHGRMEDVERAWGVFSDKHPLLLNEEELLGQAICAGWADRVAKRVRGGSASEGDRKVNAVRYQACMVKETVFLHRWSSVAKFSPEFLVYSELLNSKESKRPYMHVATSVKSDWLVKYAKSLCTFSAPLVDPKPYYDPLTDQVFSWVVPSFGPHLWQLPLHNVPIVDDVHRVPVFSASLLEGNVLPCLRSVKKFMAASPASILRPEAAVQRRVGNLLNKLKSRLRVIDSCAMLREAWDENPRELYLEILDWFQEGFHDQFEDLWAKMHHEVLLDPKERFPKRFKREKRVKRNRLS
ncbi:hypothetical protein RHMOL_Rhmol01G0381000 [Rhododendron molle]|uniref:Uncharacterized protein n=3 Tax=Rhododendron molle TaxID=49168 RepID=A0ACC0QC29_RHOML|nr:hypothetical protein RHMOL_Rhmol01G0381000 [Rhododendron molle]KAI8574786.1 hypothetical protein RHMOL_Rhmol01G0381000 [Rhododendron molle]KAI8574787.1 hypothetical protein RHMOL_Rhmol01G0381000 [Rhododendron molle]